MKKMQYRILRDTWELSNSELKRAHSNRGFAAKKNRNRSEFVKSYEPGDLMAAISSLGWDIAPEEVAVFADYEEAKKALGNYHCEILSSTSTRVKVRECWIEGLEVDEDGDYTGGEMFEEYAEIDETTAEKIAEANAEDEDDE